MDFSSFLGSLISLIVGLCGVKGGITSAIKTSGNEGTVVLIGGIFLLWVSVIIFLGASIEAEADRVVYVIERTTADIKQLLP